MKTPHSTFYKYSPESIAQANSLPAGTVAEQSHKYGMEHGEPLIVAMDCLLKYAQAVRDQYGSNIADDDVLGRCWLDAVKGVRGLLNGNGAIAIKKDITTDTKDNGCVESMFWSAMQIAGFEEKDM